MSYNTHAASDNEILVFIGKDAKGTIASFVLLVIGINRNCEASSVALLPCKGIEYRPGFFEYYYNRTNL